MFIRCTNRTFGYTIIGIVVCLTQVKAQTWDIGFNVGVGSYTYSDLHDYQAYIQKETPFDESVTENFPMYLMYNVNIQRQLKSWAIGLEAGHGSTGGRLYYEDYSGKFIADQLVRYNYVGLTPSFPLFIKNDFTITGGMKMLFTFNKVVIENLLELGNESLSEKEEFKDTNLGFQPNIAVKKSFHTIFLKVVCGYEFQTNSMPQNDEGLFIASENNEAVLLQGNGLRCTIGLGFQF